jgi:cation transport ATPase
MDFLNIPIFDDDFFKLSLMFLLNLFFLTLIIRWLYYTSSGRKDYLFTFYMISIIVFFLCFTLKKYQLDIGLALGLFAIFGIIRYRTESIPIKEMTYLFVVIGLSIMNSFANKKMSYFEIIFANAAVVLAIIIIEKVWHLKHEITKTIIYENIENIKPENYELLKTDLENRTGIAINKVEIGDVDFLKDSASIIIFYNNQVTKKVK